MSSWATRRSVATLREDHFDRRGIQPILFVRRSWKQQRQKVRGKIYTRYLVPGMHTSKVVPARTTSPSSARFRTLSPSRKISEGRTPPSAVTNAVDRRLGLTRSFPFTSLPVSSPFFTSCDRHRCNNQVPGM